MDNITHSLIGVHMARSGWAQKYGKGTLLFLILMSNIPDLDFIWARVMGGDLSFASRRMFTHSVIGFPLLSILFAVLFHIRYKQIPIRTFFWMGLAATAAHVFYDLANSYGVVVLYPFVGARLELAWLFIIDLAIWGILIIPLVLSPLIKKWMTVQKISLATLAGLGLYTGFCGVGRAISSHLLQNEARRTGPQPDYTYVFPEALGPHRFRGVIKTGNEFKIYQIPYFTGAVTLHETRRANENDKDVIRARQTPEGKKLDWFYKAPIWKKEKDGTVSVQDARFLSTVLSRDGSAFSYRFRFNENGSYEWMRFIN